MKKLLFVDDEPKVLQGLQRQLHPMRREWEMHFVEGGAKALARMASDPPDVVITDMTMPGMDGAQFLTEVMKRHPNAIRLVLSGNGDRESVLRLAGPAHQYLSKPCNPEEMRNAITRALTLRDLLSNEQLKQLATRTVSLPALPALHAQLTDELNRNDSSIERVAEIISRDIGMTTKMLQLVNSAFFGLPQTIASVSDAVLYLGLTTVRALVLSAKVFSQYDGKTVAGFSITTLEGHCWRAATLARRIARTEGGDQKIADQCFLAGLLHDAGQLILAGGLPEQYGHVLETARREKQALWEAERAEFGTTHAEVGAYLLGLWGLPNPVVEAVALHHCPGKGVREDFSPVIAVHVANAFAHDQTESHTDWPGNQIDLPAIAHLGLTERIAVWRRKCFEDHN